MNPDTSNFDQTLPVRGTPEERIDALISQAMAVADNQPRRTIELAEQIEQMSGEGVFAQENYVRGVIMSYLARGWAHLRLGNYETALHHTIDSLELARNHYDDDLVMRSLTLLGVLDDTSGDYSAAAEHTREALALARDLEDVNSQAVLLNNLGYIDINRKEYDLALQYLEESIALGEAHDLVKSLGDNYDNCCSAYHGLGEYEPALECGKRSLAIYRRINHTLGISEVLNTLGNVYADTGNYTVALQHFDESLRLSRKLGNRYESARALQRMARVHLRRGQAQAARPLLEDALEIARNIDALPLQSAAHRLLSEVCEDEDNPTAALRHYRLFHALEQVVFTDESDRRLRHLQITHEVERSRREAELQRLRSERLQAELEHQKQIESELQQRARQLEQMEQMKTDMVRLAAHDLRTPLGIMLSSLEMIDFTATAPLNNQQQKYMAEIRRVGNEMLTMLEDILSLERIEQMADFASFEPLNLSERVEQVYRTYVTRAEVHQQQTSLQLPDDPLFVRGERAQLNEAISNLIGNAIKYTPSGGTIQVRLFLQPEANQVVFEVQDTGPGIPEEHQHHLFQPFYRVESSVTEGIKGTGLGLHLVKRIVERHQGQIVFQSVEGEGSTFGFSLPWSHVEPDTAEIDTQL